MKRTIQAVARLPLRQLGFLVKKAKHLVLLVLCKTKIAVFGTELFT